MDIHSIAPKDPSNNYWRSNIGGWSELGGYVYEIAADTINTIGAGEEYWFSNSGGTFDEECCERIAAEVHAHIAEHGLPEMRAESIIPFCEFLENSGGIEIW